MPYFCQVLSIIKVPDYARLNLQEAKRNHLIDISTKNATLKETNS